LTAERVERRLAAVLAADVAGYSRLMGVDEEGTLARLKAVRKALVDPAITSHRGRIVKTSGDGMLVEFASAVDAVTCAMQVQDKMAEHNGNATEKITFRIGINVGDIIFDGDDIFGDGVNVAARVEAECEPGGVYLSANAYEQIRSKTSFSFDDMGEKHLKNIDRPIRLYSARAGQPKVAPQGSERPTNTSSHDVSKPLVLPDKPSIAVLPFQNISGDPEQEYFADGMVEDIITALSRVKSFFVIARNSSFTYKGKHVDIRQVGRELGVRYVLEGSVRKSGNRVRITGQLIEAANGNHVWADKFEGGLEDVFELQDRITETVVAAIEPSVQAAEIQRSSFKPTDSLDAYDLYLRALSLQYFNTHENLDEALRLLDRAIALDPDYAFAKAIAASVQCTRNSQGWTTADDMTKGGRLAYEALLSNRDEPTTIATAAHALAWLTRDYDTALAAMARAIQLNPNSAHILLRSGWLRVWVCDADVAIPEFLRAIRLSPLDPSIGWTLCGLAVAFLIKGEYEKALEHARRSVREMPRWISALRTLAVAAVKADRQQEAEETVRRILLLSPDHSIAKERRSLAYRDDWVREMLLDGLRVAGLPE
jgi:adenylate cyclase